MERRGRFGAAAIKCGEGSGLDPDPENITGPGVKGDRGGLFDCSVCWRMEVFVMGDKSCELTGIPRESTVKPRDCARRSVDSLRKLLVAIHRSWRFFIISKGSTGTSRLMPDSWNSALYAVAELLREKVYSRG